MYKQGNILLWLKWKKLQIIMVEVSYRKQQIELWHFSGFRFGTSAQQNAMCRLTLFEYVGLLFINLGIKGKQQLYIVSFINWPFNKKKGKMKYAFVITLAVCVLFSMVAATFKKKYGGGYGGGYGHGKVWLFVNFII